MGSISRWQRTFKFTHATSPNCRASRFPNIHANMVLPPPLPPSPRPCLGDWGTKRQRYFLPHHPSTHPHYRSCKNYTAHRRSPVYSDYRSNRWHWFIGMLGLMTFYFVGRCQNSIFYIMCYIAEQLRRNVFFPLWLETLINRFWLRTLIVFDTFKIFNL